MSASEFDIGPLDLSRCDQEPIHIPGSIQPHGALLGLDPSDLSIVLAGGDTLGLLGMQPATLLGTAAAAVLPQAEMARLRQILDTSPSLSRPAYVFSLTRNTPRIINVIVHLSGGLLVMELEPQFQPNPENALALAKGMVRYVQQAATIDAMLTLMAKKVRDVTGFDRVMVYRFAPDGSGQIMAEARGEGIDSFLHCNFPASDIPRQARALYLANWIRHIPDARYAPAHLVPPLNPLTNGPLDLSQSILRSVSPVHRQYLANMGVVASMSLSLIVNGRLWGLIACHHQTPHFLPHRLRDVCELFAEMISAHLAMTLVKVDLEAQLQSARCHEALVIGMAQESDLADGLTRYRPNLLDLILATGVGLWIEGRFSAIGNTPDAGQVEALVGWLNRAEKEGVFQTNNLPAVYPPARDFPKIASGLLALSISRTPRDYILWFRPEVARTVVWGGDPRKPVDGDSEKPLTPRHSFAAWHQSVSQHSAPWLDNELDAAHRLRVALLETVLRRTDRTAREREVARLEQEAVAKELDLRLEEWRSTAEALHEESARRATLEAELSMVLRRTVADQEAERLRVARELHDVLGQSLTLLQLGLDGLGRTAPNNTDFQERLVAMKALSTAFGRDLNRLAWEIRPTALDDLGIEIAIRNLLENWSDSSGIQSELHLTLDGRRLPADVQTTLYRCLQEALTNVVRHAEATRVDVVLASSDKNVSLIIEDNGCGFVMDEAGVVNSPSKRLGLLGIRERLALVNGSLEIESGPDKGTTIFIRIPL